MRVRYVGPFRPGAFVPLGPFTGIEIEYRKAGEVPDDIGAGLIIQPDWELVSESPPARLPVLKTPAAKLPAAGNVEVLDA